MKKILFLVFLFQIWTASLAQNLTWRRHINMQGSSQSEIRFLRSYGERFLFGVADFRLSPTISSQNSHLLFDTSGTLLIKEYQFYGDTNLSSPIWLTRSDHVIGRIMNPGPGFNSYTQFEVFSNDLSSSKIVRYNQPYDSYILGAIHTVLNFKDKYAFVLGRRGNFSFDNTNYNYWLKLDTSGHILDSKDKNYFTRDDPMAACWTQSGKIKGFSHGIFFTLEDSLSYSSYDIDTSGNFSPKRKHQFPEIPRRVATQAPEYPTFISINNFKIKTL